MLPTEEENQHLYERLLDANNLRDAFIRSKKNVGWKESVQRYEANMLRNINKTRKLLDSHKYVQKPFYEFPLFERGKRRHIKSLHISDRVINRAVCDYILTPTLSGCLIYDNGASLKGKGIGFTRRRLETHLNRYYRLYKTNDGWILIIDFTKFFDNIDHEKLIYYINTKISDEDAMGLIQYLISTFDVDVSYLTDEEYLHCKDGVFNSLEYFNEIPKELMTGEKVMDKSLGIGSQISQISGIFYPTPIDTYCKVVRGCHFYGRYMDDSYVISNNKEYLKSLLEDIIRICADLGIHVNEKKTQICSLRQFTYLKTNYIFTESGKIIRRMPHDNIVREERKLKSLANLVDNGTIDYHEARTSYSSWRGSAQWYNANRTIENMDNLYNQLFIDNFHS